MDKSPREKRGAAPSCDAPSCVVVSDSVFVAGAISRSLRLPCSVLNLPHKVSDLPERATSAPTPALAVVVQPKGDALGSAVRALRRRWPHTRVLAVDLPNREEAILQALAADVDGIMLAEEPVRQLARAARAVLSGTFRSPPQLIRPFFNRLVRLRMGNDSGQGRPPVVRLTTREIEILGRLDLGDSNKAIAVGLHIEVQTVKNHITDMLRKLGVRSRYDAVRIAAQHLRRSV